MSYQPSPYGAVPPTPAPYGAAPVQQAPAAAPVKKSKGLVWLGLALGVVGLGAGAALIVLSGSAKEETVKKFARAPVGCTTTLDFSKKATFTLYLETKGTLDDVGGDCGANGGSYDFGDDTLPKVTLSLVDSDDNEVDLSSADGPSYSAGAFKGQAIQTVSISDPGSYRLTVTSDAEEIAIAVGGDPDADASTMKSAGLGAIVAGLVLGGLLLVLGLRKKGGTAAPAAVAAPPYQPQGVPGAVPGYQPQQPVYQQPPAQQPPAYQPQPPAYQQPPVQPTYQQPQPPPQPTYPQQPPQAPPTQNPPQGPGTGWGAPQQ